MTKKEIVKCTGVSSKLILEENDDINDGQYLKIRKMSMLCQNSSSQENL